MACLYHLGKTFNLNGTWNGQRINVPGTSQYPDCKLPRTPLGRLCAVWVFLVPVAWGDTVDKPHLSCKLVGHECPVCYAIANLASFLRILRFSVQTCPVCNFCNNSKTTYKRTDIPVLHCHSTFNVRCSEFLLFSFIVSSWFFKSDGLSDLWWMDN